MNISPLKETILLITYLMEVVVKNYPQLQSAITPQERIVKKGMIGFLETCLQWLRKLLKLEIVIKFMNEEKNDKKIAHLGFIQGIITRMGGNLFTLRGWMITLVVALSVAFLEVGRNELQIILVLVVLIFWVHDAYFLSLERSYRCLYNKVRKLDEEAVDFSMDVSEFSNLRTTSVWYCMLSKTLAFFYVPTLLLIALISIF